MFLNIYFYVMNYNKNTIIFYNNISCTNNTMIPVSSNCNNFVRNCDCEIDSVINYDSSDTTGSRD